MSEEKFDGQREAVLARDGYRCVACGYLAFGKRYEILVHHRKPGVHVPRWMVTLCFACHTRIERTILPRFGFPPALLPLWREKHRGLPEQMFLPLEGGSQPKTPEQLILAA